MICISKLSQPNSCPTGSSSHSSQNQPAPHRTPARALSQLACLIFLKKSDQALFHNSRSLQASYCRPTRPYTGPPINIVVISRAIKSRATLSQNTTLFRNRSDQVIQTGASKWPRQILNLNGKNSSSRLNGLIKTTLVILYPFSMILLQKDSQYTNRMHPFV